MKQMRHMLFAIIISLLAGSSLLLTSAAPAHASDDTGCTSANGDNGLPGIVCTDVWHDGTAVNTVTATYAKDAGTIDIPILKAIPLGTNGICRTSAFAYYVKPEGGPAVPLGDPSYQARSNCSFGNFAWFTFQVGSWIPSGSRICTKFMQNNVPVGGEPCIKLQ